MAGSGEKCQPNGELIAASHPLVRRPDTDSHRILATELSCLSEPSGRKPSVTNDHVVRLMATVSPPSTGDLLQRLSTVDFQTMLEVHALLVLSACWLAFSRRRWTTILAWLAVLGFSFAWFGVNQQWEGEILYSFSPTHGLTRADLLVPQVIGIALAVRGVRFAGRTVAKWRRDRISAGAPSILRTRWPAARP